MVMPSIYDRIEKKYKDMKSKLEKIFHDMRVGSLQKNADDTDEQR